MALVEYERLHGGICKITLNDPDKLNAMSEAMAEQFSSQIDELKGENDLRAIVLTGAGRAFSAGGDLKMLEAKTKLSRDENKKRMLEYYDSFLKIMRLKVPIIAAINGHAVGAGLCLACAADIRVCAESAKLGLTFTKLGLHPGMGVSYILPKIIGISEASHLMLTGKVIFADEAYRIGLVNSVVKDGETLNEALKIAGEISSNSALAVSQLLQTLRKNFDGLSQALEREAECQSENYASEEFSLRIKAMINRKKR